MILRALAVWLLLVVLAIANGAFREAVLIPHLGEITAHIISTILLSALILLTTWLTIEWIGPTTPTQSIVIGFVWLALTVLFEFGAGHFLFRQPWVQLFADYNLAKGRIWILVLIVTLKAPTIAASMRRLFEP
jgi:hypothetical protein